MSSTKDTIVLIITFFSLNFSSIEIDGKRVSSSQNERTLGGGRGRCSKTYKGKQVGREGVKTREAWANILFECPLMEFNSFHFSCTKNSLWSEIPRSITPDWKVFSVEFVRIWSIRVETLHGTRVGDLINCFKDWIWQNSFYVYLS